MAKVYVFCGPPCSGKTTASIKFAEEIGAKRMCVDDEVARKKRIRQSHRDTAYGTLALLACTGAKNGKDFVLDATYARVRVRRELELTAKTFGVELVIKEMLATPDEAVRRFRERKEHPATDLNESRVRNLAEQYPYGWSAT